MSEEDKNKQLNNEPEEPVKDEASEQEGEPYTSLKDLNASDVKSEEDVQEETGIMAVNNSSNTHLVRLMGRNYLEYASYVIKERAIPDLNDGLKPVQRRILWSMFKMDDGKFHKVANIVGHSMQFHPHGDASIYEALVHMANKEYFIEKQGNFGNIFTGDAAAAARYIEARLTPLAKEVIFNNDITEFVDSYDGRNKEPVSFPAKVPALLMLGQEGLAPGMTTSILPHNFVELLNAQIAILNGEHFELYPDFLQGGIMDVSEYDDGRGRVVLRAKIEIDGRRLVIREIPAMTTTEKLIASIELAANKNKIKIASINDYTGENVEIEVIPARGYTPEKALKALYAYTACTVPVTSSMLVIKDNKPLVMSVSEILRYNTEKLVEYLKNELKLKLENLNEKFHEKSLERIFIENRIYKRIEECETQEKVMSEVRKGLNKFRDQLKRDITDEDIERLLAIPIRRISLYDLNKNQDDIKDILKGIKETEKNLRNIKHFTISYIKKLLETYGKSYPRRTEIEAFEKIDKKAIALNNIKVGWDKKNCYIGSAVKSEDTVTCNEYDNLVCIEKSGKYKVISIPQKIFIGRLTHFGKHDKTGVFCIVYKENKTSAYFIKRCVIDKFIRDKDYNIIPPGCQIELISPRDNSIFECAIEGRKGGEVFEDIDFSKVQMRSPGARGLKFTNKKILKFRYKCQADGEGSGSENPPEIPDDEGNGESGENGGGAVPAPTQSDKSDKSDRSELSSEKRLKTEKIDMAIPAKAVKEKAIEQEFELKEEPEISKQAGKKALPVQDKKAIEKSEEEPQRKIKQTKPDPETVKAVNPEKPVIAKTEKEKPSLAEITKTEKPASAVSSKKQSAKDKNKDSEEDWGIIQPDLGF